MWLGRGRAACGSILINRRGAANPRMEAHMKDNQQVKPNLDIEAGTVTFEFRGAEPLVFHIDRCAESIRRRAALAGMAQVRLVDAAAVGREAPDGSIRTVAEMVALKREAIARLIEHYESGTEEWGLRVAGEGRGSGDGGLVIQGIIRVYGGDVAQAEATITRTMEKRGLERKAALALWASTDKVATAIADIKAERAKARAGVANVNSDDLLDELCGD